MADSTAFIWVCIILGEVPTSASLLTGGAALKGAQHLIQPAGATGVRLVLYKLGAGAAAGGAAGVVGQLNKAPAIFSGAMTPAEALKSAAMDTLFSLLGGSVGAATTSVTKEALSDVALTAIQLWAEGKLTPSEILESGPSTAMNIVIGALAGKNARQTKDTTQPPSNKSGEQGGRLEDGSQRPVESGEGTTGGTQDIPAKPPKASPFFKNVKEDSSVLPIEIDTSTNIEVKEPRTLPFRQGGGALRQEVIIKPPPSTLVQYLNDHFETNLPMPSKGASPKIVLVNHSYYDDWAPNFKIEVVVGKNDYVVGFDPAKPPGRPDFRDGGVTFPPGAILVHKDWYNKVLKGEIFDSRLSRDGKIQRLVDGMWVDYMSSHWPYR